MKYSFTSHHFHKKECWVVFLLALLLIFLKMPDRILHGFLWAEDTFIFMKSAYEQGGNSLWIPYADYLHLTPRLIAYVQSLFFTVPSAPYCYAWACALMTALCSAYTFDVAKRYFTNLNDHASVFKFHWEDHLLAFLMAFSFFFVPHQGEVFLNITNLQWILAPTLLILLFDIFLLQENSSFFLGIKTGALFLIALTGPFSLLFFPFATLLMMSKGKNIQKLKFLFPSAVIFLGALIQGITLLTQHASAKNTDPIHWWDKIINDLLAQLFFVNPITQFFLGKLCIILVSCFILFSVLACLKRSPVPLLLVIAALELWCVSLIVRKICPEVTMHVGPCDYNARYYFLPALFLAWALILCIKLLPLKIKFLPIILLSLLFITGLIRFHGQKHPGWTITKEADHYDVRGPYKSKATITIPE